MTQFNVPQSLYHNGKGSVGRWIVWCNKQKFYGMGFRHIKILLGAKQPTQVLQKRLWSLLDYWPNFWNNRKKLKFLDFSVCVKKSQGSKRRVFSEGNGAVIRRYRPDGGRLWIQYFRSLSSRSKGLYTYFYGVWITLGHSEITIEVKKGVVIR